MVSVGYPPLSFGDCSWPSISLVALAADGLRLIPEILTRVYIHCGYTTENYFTYPQSNAIFHGLGGARTIRYHHITSMTTPHGKFWVIPSLDTNHV